MKSKITSVLALLTIASVLAISGCTLLPSGGTTGGGPGIAIERFEPSLSTVRSNEQVSLRLEVRNNGDYTNAPAAAELMGIDPAKWNLYGNTMQYLGTLLAPDAASNTPGGRGTASWTLVSPPLVRGQSLTYRPIARVYYQYETRAIKPVTFVTANELKDIQRGGGSLTSEPTTYTNGPLSVQVTTGNFVQAPEIGAGEYKFQVQFNIENIGQGKIYGVNNPIAVQIEYPQFVVPLGECPRSEQTEWVPYATVPQGLNSPLGTFVEMWDGRSVDLTCDFSIVQPPADITTADFQVRLGYIYYVDATTQIMVQGQQSL